MACGGREEEGREKKSEANMSFPPPTIPAFESLECRLIFGEFAIYSLLL
jgi:hypothetical protein